MARITKLTEADLNRLVKRIIKEQPSKPVHRMGAILEPKSTENSETIPAKQFIETLYDIADKYGKADIKLSFDGKYIIGTENNTRQKFKITIT